MQTRFPLWRSMPGVAACARPMAGMGLPGTQRVVRSASRSTSARTPQSGSVGKSRSTPQANEKKKEG